MIAQEGDEPVTQLQVDHVAGEPAYLDIAVHPDLRGKGLEQSLLTAFRNAPGSTYSVVAKAEKAEIVWQCGDRVTKT